GRHRVSPDRHRGARAGRACRRVWIGERSHPAPARRNRGSAAVIVGQDRAVEQFASSWTTRKLHHAWLLAGPKGVGKSTFALAAAKRVLADAAGPPGELPGVQASADHPMVKLVEAGSHPDMRWLQRLVTE